MPISADIQMDPNKCGYGLPLDSCVGDAGPSPTEVTTISKSGPKASGASMGALKGGDPYAGDSGGADLDYGTESEEQE